MSAERNKIPNVPSMETVTNWKQHDEIKAKMYALNAKLGLKFLDRLTYDKLAEKVSVSENITFQDAYRLGVDKLIELFTAAKPKS